MATLVASVQDCQTYWHDIVEPDYHDFNANIDDLRCEFHCAIGLFHMSDRVYVTHKSHIDGNFIFKEKNGASQLVSDEKTFANALRDLCPNFELIRGIAKFGKTSAAKEIRLPSVFAKPRRKYQGTEHGVGRRRIWTRPVWRDSACHASRSTRTGPGIFRHRNFDLPNVEVPRAAARVAAVNPGRSSAGARGTCSTPRPYGHHSTANGHRRRAQTVA